MHMHPKVDASAVIHVLDHVKNARFISAVGRDAWRLLGTEGWNLAL